jgi:hypothetical protein
LLNQIQFKLLFFQSDFIQEQCFNFSTIFPLCSTVYIMYICRIEYITPHSAYCAMNVRGARNVADGSESDKGTSTYFIHGHNVACFTEQKKSI